MHLSELFRGTPVVFATQSDGGLRLAVAVPMRYCSERGSAAVKPPLAAVLDRVAKSQLSDATRLRVAAAGDASVTAPTLACSRAQGTIDYLAAHGIKPARLTAYAATRAEGVEIVVAESATH